MKIVLCRYSSSGTNLILAYNIWINSTSSANDDPFDYLFEWKYWLNTFFLYII